MTMNYVKYLTLDELVDCLIKKYRFTFTKKEVVEWCDSGYLPHHRFTGKGYLFVWKEVKDWIDNNAVIQVSPKNVDWVGNTVYIPTNEMPNRVPLELMSFEKNLHHFDTSIFFSGIYFLVKKGRVVYIGQSINILGRIDQHKYHGKQFDQIFFLPVPKSKLNEVERAFIKKLKPSEQGVMYESFSLEAAELVTKEYNE